MFEKLDGWAPPAVPGGGKKLPLTLSPLALALVGGMVPPRPMGAGIPAVGGRDAAL
jgi:hypothetical protein